MGPGLWEILNLAIRAASRMKLMHKLGSQGKMDGRDGRRMAMCCCRARDGSPAVAFVS